MAGTPEMQEHFPAWPWMAGTPEMQEHFSAWPCMPGDAAIFREKRSAAISARAYAARYFDPAAGAAPAEPS
jgi:hypothetical protein